jgi:regulator of replication initiation timing
MIKLQGHNKYLVVFDCVFFSNKSEISEMEDDIAYLKTQVRRLKRKMNKLDTEGVEWDWDHSKFQKTMTKENEKNEKETDKILDFESFVMGVRASQFFAMNLFYWKSYKNCFITGKTSPKSVGSGRPALDQEKVTQMFNFILKINPGTELKIIVEQGRVC